MPRKRHQTFISFAAARRTVQSLGIRSNHDYRRFFPKQLAPLGLPSNPNVAYADQWRGWPYFLGNGRKSPVSAKTDRFLTFEEARAVVAKSSVRTCLEYGRRHKWRKTSRLPRNPFVTYRAEWQGWPHFLGKGEKTLEEIAALCKKARIRTATQYVERPAWRRRHGLPTQPPEGLFESRYIKDAVSYAEARRLMRDLKVTTERDYHALSLETRKRYRLPAEPRSAYEGEWRGVKDFFALARVASS